MSLIWMQFIMYKFFHVGLSFVWCYRQLPLNNLLVAEDQTHTNMDSLPNY